jgi:hypothetical protein
MLIEGGGRDKGYEEGGVNEIHFFPGLLGLCLGCEEQKEKK